MMSVLDFIYEATVSNWEDSNIRHLFVTRGN